MIQELIEELTLVGGNQYPASFCGYGANAPVIAPYRAAQFIRKPMSGESCSDFGDPLARLLILFIFD
ncbi:hypothetical protein M527_01130 [Sphingobium indicum IP26]|nr:hypothetical protein M527_01130 [Sphingobium indicum IP26]